MKTHLMIRIVSILLVLAIAPWGAAFAQGQAAISVKSAPLLAERGVPRAKTTRPVKGKVTLDGLKAKDCAIIAFVIDGEAWIKPYARKYLTSVKSNGSFSVKITTGGYDRKIDRFRLFLVKRADFKKFKDAPGMDEVAALAVADTGTLKKSELAS